MDTGCPSFIPEPDNHDKGRPKPRKEHPENDERDQPDTQDVPSSNQHPMKPLSFMGKQFHSLP